MSASGELRTGSGGEGTPAGGPVDSSRGRSSGGPPAAKPYVLVSVRPILAEPSTEADVYQLAIVNTNDELVWSSELTVEGMRRQMRASGALIFPVSSTLLAPGKHEMRVTPKKNPLEPILQVPFEIVPAK